MWGAPFPGLVCGMGGGESEPEAGIHCSLLPDYRDSVAAYLRLLLQESNSSRGRLLSYFLTRKATNTQI